MQRTQLFVLLSLMVTATATSAIEEKVFYTETSSYSNINCMVFTPLDVEMSILIVTFIGFIVGRQRF